MKKMAFCCVLLLSLLLLVSACGTDSYVAQDTAEALTWRQCPEPVRNYLEYVAANPYPEDDYTTTVILNYVPAEADQANTKPISKTIGDFTFTDNVPGEPVRIESGRHVGTMTAVDPLRWINTTLAPPSGNAYSQGYNCRDLGGWPCDGGTVRYGMLVRSGELNPADKTLMVDTIGIRTEINLLPKDQQARNGSAWGIDYVANPTDVDFAYHIDESVRDQWELYLRTAIDSVADHKPVVFHCGAGADKTGTFAVMLLGLLGCDTSAIDQDYELTNFSVYTDWRNRTYGGYVAYLNAIRQFPLALGLPDSFQNHCISFALSLGITLDEINEFRTACIDGTPEAIITRGMSGSENILESVGYLFGKRISPGAEELINETGFCCTGLIPIKQGNVIRVSGISFDGNGAAAVYDNTGKYLSGVSGLASDGSSHGRYGDAEIDEGSVFTWRFGDDTDAAAAYLRVSGMRDESVVFTAVKK